MSYIYCSGSIASQPYTIKNNGLNIYTIEELCYYLYNNLYEIDDNFVNRSLCTFINDELKMPILSQKLSDMIKDNAKNYELLITLVSACDYLDAQELLDFKTSLQRFAGCKNLQRHKLKADSLVKKGRLESAIQSYNAIIQDNEFESQNEAFISYVYYNLAVAKAYLFNYREAFEDFYKAYKYKQDDRNLFTTLTALYMSLDDKNDFTQKAIDYGFTITRVAHVEEVIKDCFKNAKISTPKSISEIVHSARTAIS